MVSAERPAEYEALKRMEVFEFFRILKIYEDNQDKRLAKINKDVNSNTRPRR